MLNDRRTFYRWQDHVITTRETAGNLIATALIGAVAGAALFAACRAPAAAPWPVAHVATEQTPSLAELAKRRATPRYTEIGL